MEIRGGGVFEKTIREAIQGKGRDSAIDLKGISCLPQRSTRTPNRNTLNSIPLGQPSSTRA